MPPNFLPNEYHQHRNRLGHLSGAVHKLCRWTGGWGRRRGCHTLADYELTSIRAVLGTPFSNTGNIHAFTSGSGLRCRPVRIGVLRVGRWREALVPCQRQLLLQGLAFLSLWIAIMHSFRPDFYKSICFSGFPYHLP